MKNNCPDNEIQQQSKQQRPDIPLSDELSMSINKYNQSNSQQEKRITSLENRAINTGKLMELLTGIIAIITLGGVAIAYFQWQSGREQFYKDQRPYVIPRISNAILPNEKAIRVDLSSGNYGKSPAIKVRQMGKIFWGPFALAQADEWFEKEAPNVFSTHYETIIPPGTPASNLEASQHTIQTGAVIGAEEYNSLLTRDFSIIVVMRVAYTDGIETQYLTDFCAGYLTTKAIVHCPKHNEIH